jgi:spermidine synthase
MIAGTRRRAAFAALMAAGMLAIAGAWAAAAGALGRVVFQKNSLYHRIFVYRRGSVYTLRFGARRPLVLQSQVDRSRPRRHMLEYTRLAFAGLLYKSQPEKILVLGLGGGVIPRELHHYFPEATVEVAEIDPDIPPIARRFFGFKPDEKLKVHVDDGRRFIQKQLRREAVPKYDLIVLDAFLGDYIPFHLMTREFLEEVRGVLADDGVVVANVFYTNRLCDAEMMTFLAVFKRCQVYMGRHSSNAMLVSPGPEGPVLTPEQARHRARMVEQRHEFSFSLRQVASRLRPGAMPHPRAPVLTDDRAPVNWLRTRKTRQPLGVDKDAKKKEGDEPAPAPEPGSSGG